MCGSAPWWKSLLGLWSLNTLPFSRTGPHCTCPLVLKAPHRDRSPLAPLCLNVGPFSSKPQSQQAGAAVNSDTAQPINTDEAGYTPTPPTNGAASQPSRTCSQVPLRTPTWKARLRTWAPALRPPRHVARAPQSNLGQLIPANSVLSVLHLLLNLTNLTFMVHWLASVSGAGCKFTLKSFVLTAFNRAPRRVRTGSLTTARPPALITVSKSGFEPLGWSLGPTQKGLTWRKVNLCHTCVTIWIMEFCNLSERGG